MAFVGGQLDLLSLAFGANIFEHILKGAALADKNATQEDITKNAPLMDALIGVFERNVQGYSTTAILPYSQGLSRFPAHLQQLDMESNGKSVNRFGKKISYKTGPVIFAWPRRRSTAASSRRARCSAAGTRSPSSTPRS